MELREMLVIIGLVLIAVIIWDGIRRMQSRKKSSRYRGTYSKTPESEDFQDPEELQRQAELARELPNGGARIRHMTAEERAQLTSRLNLRERVPMLMDSVEVAPEVEAAAETTQPDSTQQAKQQSLDFDQPVERPRDEAMHTQSEAKAATPEPPAESESAFDFHRDDEPPMGDWHFSAKDDFEPDFGESQEDEDSRAEPATTEPEFEAIESGPSRAAEQPPLDDSADDEVQASALFEPDSVDEPETDWPEPEETTTQPEITTTASRQASDSEDDQYEEDTRPVEELVIMHVMAKGERDIAGSELLELLLRAGLRFGPMDIFHYRNPKGQLEFSLANSVQPGTLNPDTMDQMTTPGITLFMQLPQHADMMTSFDHLYEMAIFLSRQLDAVILDEEHSTVTSQRVEHYRERLRNFARTQLIQAHE